MFPWPSISAEIYRIVTSPTLPTIPLFGFAGYILAVGNVSRRLVRFFRAIVGWMPGGIAVVTVLVCTFFTTFTGASGVTIVALGGSCCSLRSSWRGTRRGSPSAF